MSATHVRLVFVTLVLLSSISARGDSQVCESAELAAVADSVAHAFDKHQLVFIGSTHGGKKPHDFLLCLLSRPALQQRVRDVVVEWATASRQSLADRYLLLLQPLPLDSLVPVWFDTEAPDLWARLTLIPEFYSAVRTINSKLDPANRIRVIGGADPTNWSAVRTAEDFAGYPFKTNWMTHLITEHLVREPERRVLVVYGEGHIYHNGRSFVVEVEATLGRRQFFVVGTIDALAPNDATRIARFGDTLKVFYRSAPNFPKAAQIPQALFLAESGPLEDYIDAVVYLGPKPDRDLSHSITFTDAQRRELARRDAIRGDPRRMMQLRYAARDKWFQAHPNEIPRRP